MLRSCKRLNGASGHESGFSLIEAVISLAILAILAASMGHLARLSTRTHTSAGISISINNLVFAALNYHAENRSWPTSVQALQQGRWLPNGWNSRSPGIDGQISIDAQHDRLRVALSPVDDQQVVNSVASQINYPCDFSQSDRSLVLYVYEPMYESQEDTTSPSIQDVWLPIDEPAEVSATTGGGRAVRVYSRSQVPVFTSLTVQLPSTATAINISDIELQQEAAAVDGSLIDLQTYEATVQAPGWSLPEQPFSTTVSAQLFSSSGQIVASWSSSPVTTKLPPISGPDYVNCRPASYAQCFRRFPAQRVDDGVLRLSGLPSGTYRLRIAVSGDFQAVSPGRVYGGWLRRTVRIGRIAIM